MTSNQSSGRLDRRLIADRIYLTPNQRAFFDRLRALCEEHGVVIGGSIGEDAPWVMFDDMPEIEFVGVFAHRDLVTISGEIVMAKPESDLSDRGIEERMKIIWEEHRVRMGEEHRARMSGKIPEGADVL